MVALIVQAKQANPNFVIFGHPFPITRIGFSQPSFRHFTRCTLSFPDMKEDKSKFHFGFGSDVVYMQWRRVIRDIGGAHGHRGRGGCFECFSWGGGCDGTLRPMSEVRVWKWVMLSYFWPWFPALSRSLSLFPFPKFDGICRKGGGGGFRACATHSLWYGSATSYPCTIHLRVYKSALAQWLLVHTYMYK